MVSIKERIVALGISVLVMATIFFLANSGGARDPVLRIAYTTDLAGVVVTAASGVTEDLHGLRLADCCGTQAEIALESGVFDMAVLCPDAAELFLQGDRPFVLVGGIVQNANVLVRVTNNSPVSIGYTFGRASQREAALEHFSTDVTFIPMTTLALPFALASGAVDAVVLDVLTATNSDAALIITPLPHERPSSVLVVREDILGTTLYSEFLRAYNETIDKGVENIWSDFGVNFLSLPEELYILP